MIIYNRINIDRCISIDFIANRIIRLGNDIDLRLYPKLYASKDYYEYIDGDNKKLYIFLKFPFETDDVVINIIKENIHFKPFYIIL